MKPFDKFVFSLGLVLVLTACGTPTQNVQNEPAEKISDSIPDINPAYTKRALDLRLEMRKLWEDQITWTRNEIYCQIDNLPGGTHVMARLLQNQDYIGDIIGRYYDRKASERITNLLKENASLTSEAIKAIKAKDTKRINSHNRQWFANADSVAVILSNVNPNYGMGELKLMLHEHIRLMSDIAEARVKKDYEGDIKAYDIAHEQSLKLADVLTEGIIHQFPDKFTATGQRLSMQN